MNRTLHKLNGLSFVLDEMTRRCSFEVNVCGVLDAAGLWVRPDVYLPDAYSELLVGMRLLLEAYLEGLDVKLPATMQSLHQMWSHLHTTLRAGVAEQREDSPFHLLRLDGGVR